MARELQSRVMQVLVDGLGTQLTAEALLPWVAAPVAGTTGRRHDAVRQIYRALSEGQDLPADPPPVARRVDALIQAGRQQAILEVDEIQHFNVFRAATIDQYPNGVEVWFPLGEWRSRSINKRKLEGGNFGTGRPMFRMVYGRHRERAFRDALADLVPPEHGFLPTIRLASWELEPWIWSADAAAHLADLLRARTALALPKPRPVAPMPKPVPVRSPSKPRATATPLGGLVTQRVTAADLARGQIRLPRASKVLFPETVARVQIELRGIVLEVRYDPRIGPDRERSAILSIPKAVLQSVVEPDEVLGLAAGSDVISLY